MYNTYFVLLYCIIWLYYPARGGGGGASSRWPTAASWETCQTIRPCGRYRRARGPACAARCSPVLLPRTRCHALAICPPRRCTSHSLTSPLRTRSVTRPPSDCKYILDGRPSGRTRRAACRRSRNSDQRRRLLFSMLRLTGENKSRKSERAMSDRNIPPSRSIAPISKGAGTDWAGKKTDAQFVI